MAPRKVAYFTPLYFDDSSCIGGGERYPVNLAKGVVLSTGSRYEIDVISYGRQSSIRELAPGVRLRILRVDRAPKNPMDAASWEVPSVVGEMDLVHIHMAYTRSSEIAILASKQQRKPICLSDHGGHSSWLGHSVGFLELIDQIVAYSDFGASFYRTTKPIRVIKGGVDGRAFRPPVMRPRRDRVVYVGRLLPHKGIDRLIRALPPELPLTVCGRPYHPEYFQMLRDLSVGKQVEFVTDASDDKIRDLYARAWANVLPSVHRDCYGGMHRAPELMGLTLLEAMACGTPAIASNLAAMPEFIDHGRTGFVFDTEDELSRQLKRLAGSPELVARMGDAAREQVERVYDLEVAGGHFAQVYDQMLDKAGSREEAA
jgi:glycosyltransferase involved in cell wall biosynthesis